MWVVLTAAFGAVALLFSGASLIAFIYRTRESKDPAEARWIQPGWHFTA